MDNSRLRFFKKILSCIAGICSFLIVQAQPKPVIPADCNSLYVSKYINKNFNERKRKFSYRSFVLPSVMIAYGFTTLHSDPLGDLNEEIKEETWTEKPHKQIRFDNPMQFAPAAAVYSLNIAGVRGENNFIDRSIIYLSSNIFLNASVSVIKHATHRQRPDGSMHSFPSGHTAEAFASAEFLRQEYKHLSPWYGIAGYITATATGFLRIYNNRHWLSDVIAGAGIGIASTKLAYWIYPLIKRKISPHKTVNAWLMPYYRDRNAGL